MLLNDRQRPRTNGRLRVLLPTIGSAGDVHPVLEIGRALQQRGHEATLVTNQSFEQQVRDAGLDFIAMGTVEEAEATIADDRLWHHIRGFECVVERAVLPNIARLYQIIREQWKPGAVVAASGFCFGAQIAQEKLRVPLATIHLQPAMLRSLVDAGMQGRIPMGPRVPRLVKQPLFWLLDKAAVDRLLAPTLNSIRAGLGLPPVSRILKGYVHSPQLVLGLFPEWFASPQPDWPRNTHLTGFVLHDGGDQQGVSAEVKEFLADGPPPLVFTPGSAASTLQAFFRTSVEVCKLTGHRAMLVTNFPKQLPENLPPGVRAFRYLPFSKILPHCSALVYPGGIGTMAQAIKAGIPHLVVPHAHDQPDNALRIRRLGLGFSIYPERYEPRRAARLVKELLASSEIRHRCALYGERIDSHAALQRACTLIEGLGG